MVRSLDTAPEAMRQWRRVVGAMKWGMTFSNGKTGIIVARKHLPRQDFSLWFDGGMREIDDIQRIIAGYEAYLILERGLSDNTREGYRADVSKLMSYLDATGIRLRDVTSDTLQEFMASLHDIGIAPRSQARVVSGVKSLFRYLKMEGYVDTNPALRLDGPKLGRQLPDVLSVEEIDRMIDAIDMDKPEGQRNRAIMETLYGCGLRVSELVNLGIDKVFMRERYVLVNGKGDKERIVPMSEVAAREIAALYGAA